MRQQYRNIKRALVLRHAVVRYNKKYRTKLGVIHLNVLFTIYEHLRLTGKEVSASQICLFLCKMNRSPNPNLVNKVIKELEDSFLVNTYFRDQRKRYSIAIGGFVVLHIVNEISKTTRTDRFINTNKNAKKASKSR